MWFSAEAAAAAADFGAVWMPLVERALARGVAEETGADHVLAAPAAYWLQAKGKGIRPLALLAACELVGGHPKDAIDAACAVELIHTASLILDDLPCMDDSMQRRGVPTLHTVFGESTAILTALLLLNLAHRRLATLDSANGTSAHERICRLLGGHGMILGQAADLMACSDRRTRRDRDLADTKLKKTTSLIIGSLELGALLGGAEEAVVDGLRRFGSSLGRTLRAADDLVDGDDSTASDASSAGLQARIMQEREIACKVLEESLVGDPRARRVLEGLLDTLAEGAVRHVAAEPS